MLGDGAGAAADPVPPVSEPGYPPVSDPVPPVPEPGHMWLLPASERQRALCQAGGRSWEWPGATPAASARSAITRW